jgi:hypothetical protein
MINYSSKGLAMNTKELKVLVSFFKRQGISPTIKELCSANMRLSDYYNNIAS